MDAENFVETHSLCKSFRDKAALNGVNLSVGKGKIVGLVGPNGAGKTTLLNHMAGLMLPTSGVCNTFGKPAGKLTDDDLQHLGVVVQEPRLVGWMTVDEMLSFVGLFYPAWDKVLEDSLVAEFQLDRKAKVKTLSTGNAQALSLVLAVCFRPKLLLLDEPAAGLDPLARSRLISFLLGLIQDGDRTVVISSHILSDIEKLVDHLVVIKDGRVVRDESLDEVRELYVQVILRPANGGAVVRPECARSFVADASGATLVVEAAELPKLTARWQDQGWFFETRPLSLEEIYRLEMER